MKSLLLSAFLCYFSCIKAHAIITIFEPDCVTSRSDVALKETEDLNEMSPFALILSINSESRELLVNTCGRQKETTEQIPCLYDLLSDNSLTYKPEDKRILLHIRDHFKSLRAFVLVYDQEVKKCNEYYYTYNSPGFCIPYTGQKCLDHFATISFKLGTDEVCLYYEIRVFLTPEGQIEEEFYKGVCVS